MEEKETPTYLTKRHSRSQIPVGCFALIRYPLVARAEPSNSVQERTNKKVC